MKGSKETGDTFGINMKMLIKYTNYIDICYVMERWEVWNCGQINCSGGDCGEMTLNISITSL